MEDFPYVVLNVDVAVIQAKEILLNVLQKSGEYWKVEELRRLLEQECLYFKYAITRDVNRNQAQIGVVLKTKIMREAFRQFGCILYINAMKH